MKSSKKIILLFYMYFRLMYLNFHKEQLCVAKCAFISISFIKRIRQGYHLSKP